MAQKFKLQHPEGKFVHQNSDGEYILQNGDESAIAMTLAEFRKTSKYIKKDTLYRRGNLQYVAGTINKWIWNGGTELAAIEQDSKPINKTGEQIPSGTTVVVDKETNTIEPAKHPEQTLEEKVLDWAFKGIEFNHNNGEVESSGELLYIEAVKEGENPFLVAGRLESKQMMRFRVYSPNKLSDDIKEMIRSKLKEHGWRGVLL